MHSARYIEVALDANHIAASVAYDTSTELQPAVRTHEHYKLQSVEVQCFPSPRSVLATNSTYPFIIMKLILVISALLAGSAVASPNRLTVQSQSFKLATILKSFCSQLSQSVLTVAYVLEPLASILRQFLLMGKTSLWKGSLVLCLFMKSPMLAETAMKIGSRLPLQCHSSPYSHLSTGTVACPDPSDQTDTPDESDCATVITALNALQAYGMTCSVYLAPVLIRGFDPNVF